MGAVAALLALLVLCALCDGDRKKYKKGDLRISRDSDGGWYVWEKSTGNAVFKARTRQECADYIRTHIS